MAASWGFAMLLVLTLIALITFTHPLFQSESPVVVVVGQTHDQSDLRLAPESGAEEMQRNLRTLEAGSLGQLRARKLIHHNTPATTRRSVLATFQSDRMVPTGPNPLHNSNRSQVIFP